MGPLASVAEPVNFPFGFVGTKDTEARMLLCVAQFTLRPDQMAL